MKKIHFDNAEDITSVKSFLEDNNLEEITGGSNESITHSQDTSRGQDTAYYRSYPTTETN